MATVNDLLSLVDTMYPNAETTATKITFMNLAQETLSNEFGVVAEDTSITTVDGTDSYEFPSGITDVAQIVSVAIGNSATPSDRYDYTQYVLSKGEDNPMLDYSYSQIINSGGSKKLCLYPVPTETGLPVVIRFRKKLTPLSANDLGAEPEFNDKFHSLLAFYCAHWLCAMGSSPDSYQADMFMQKYDDMLGEMWEDTMDDAKKVPSKRRDNRQWHRSKSFRRGY